MLTAVGRCTLPLCKDFVFRHKFKDVRELNPQHVPLPPPLHILCLSLYCLLQLWHQLFHQLSTNISKTCLSEYTFEVNYDSF